MTDIPEPIRSAQNQQIQRVRKWLAHPAELRRDNVFLADGFHLLEEAIAADYSLRTLFFNSENFRPELRDLIDLAEDRGATLQPVVPRLFRSLSPTQSPQGALGIFDRIAGTSIPKRGTLVVADGIQDPGNLGSICRSARAAGAVGVATLAGSADLFHPRVLRAAMGATFAWPFEEHRDLSDLRSNGSDRIWIALSNSGDARLTDLDPATDYALVLGSEGNGLRRETAEQIDRHVRIPMAPGVESLGVAAAAAVALFWLRLQNEERGPEH